MLLKLDCIDSLAAIVTGDLHSTSVNLLSASVDDGDTIRLRATYTSGTSAKSEALATGIIGITGLSFLTTQDDDTAYNTLALDGSTITKFTIMHYKLYVKSNYHSTY